MRKAIFYSKVLVLICAVTLASSACSKKSNTKKSRVAQFVRINIESEPRTLDPRKARTLGEMNLIRTFYDGLLRLNQEGVPTHALAQKYLLSSDKKTYTFFLRESMWSNGDPLTAHDFVYTWKKTLSPDFLSDYAFLLYPIKNAKAVKEGSLPTSMLGVRAENDFTLVVELEQATPFFLQLVTLPAYFPVNPTNDKENSDWSRHSETYVSNGPFNMKEWQHNDHIIAAKNDRYWDKNAVQIDYISMPMVDAETGFLMYENKELDWQGSPYSLIPTTALETLKDQNRAHFRSSLGTFWIRTNTAVFPLSSIALRKAIALAINRSEIVKHVTCGNQVPATGIVPTSLGLQPTPYFADGDIEQARRFFASALEKEKIDPENFPEITLSYVASSRNHNLAQAVQDQLRTGLSIKLKLEPLETKVFFDRVSKKDYQMACGAWIADFSDPVSFLEVFKAKTIGSNNTNWESLDYQKALEASYLASTENERKEALQKTESIIMNEMPVIPIYHHSMVYVQNEKLKNVVLSDAGSIDFKWAYFVE